MYIDLYASMCDGGGWWGGGNTYDAQRFYRYIITVQRVLLYQVCYRWPSACSHCIGRVGLSP